MNQSSLRHSVRTLPLNDSINALSVGFPGRLKSRTTWLSYAQRSTALDVNSVPLSTRIDFGKAHSAARRHSTSTTAVAGNRCLAVIAKLSRVKRSTIVNKRIRRPSNSSLYMKSIAQQSLMRVASGRSTRLQQLTRRFGVLDRKLRFSSRYRR